MLLVLHEFKIGKKKPAKNLFIVKIMYFSFPKIIFSMSKRKVRLQWKILYPKKLKCLLFPRAKRFTMKKHFYSLDAREEWIVFIAEINIQIHTPIESSSVQKIYIKIIIYLSSSTDHHK